MAEKQHEHQTTHAGTQNAEHVQTTAGVTPAAFVIPGGALTKRVARIMPSMGTARQNDAQLAAGSMNAATIPVGTTTLPPTGIFSIPISEGKVRVKVYGTTTAVTAVNMTVYDGATPGTGNSESIAGYSGSLPIASATTASANVLFDFQSDLSITSVTIAVVGGTGGSMDVDIGATSA